MNKVYKFILSLFLIFAFGIVEAQNSNNHLEPVGGIFDVYDFKFEYYSEVRKVLFNGLTDAPEIRFLVMPSFTPVSVLDIEYDRENNKYHLAYHICKEMIWYNKNLDKVKVKKFRTEIDEESVDLIKTLFDKIISQTKYPERETMGCDGTNYYFSIRKFGLKSGTVWSPPEGTKLEKFVDIGFTLVELAKSKKAKVHIDKEFQKEIESLLNE